MSLDQATVARIAVLARIKLPEADREKMAKELSGILDWVEMLKDLDTSKVEPMTSTVEMVLPQRADKVTDGDYPAAILANATEPVRISNTEEAGGFFTVPKVVE
ncbi:MAG: Asp-tRNA(Asn)/Glu-tRNA(Gln) amidotransferase subunit GatC [Alphaproteobacteria bacterium]|nr:Asp-tRNA(Asn)/Glu-tRNA(Gln) amidotransferase subunit GatC [Alphaproteobacteria bacterium]